MPNLNDAARRLCDDAEHSGFKLGAKSTARLLAMIEYMAADIEELKDSARAVRLAAHAAARA